MTWVRSIPADEAAGLLKEAYDWQAERLGGPTEFTMLGGVYPEIVMERLRLYRVVESCPSKLDQTERQMAAFVTSCINRTEHCASGLRVKLAELGVSADTVKTIESEPRNVRTGLARLDAILQYAAVLAVDPGDVTEQHIESLRTQGLDDLDIVDLNNMVAYYSYINRVATGLGLRTPIPSAHATAAMPHTNR
jgi:uncharacterized peroxidase-related enzyme